jgi:membrane protein YdbS with pleckstrin-like domain
MSDPYLPNLTTMSNMGMGNMGWGNMGWGAMPMGSPINYLWARRRAMQQVRKQEAQPHSQPRPGTTRHGTGEQLLAQACELYEQRRYTQSADTFAQLVGHPDLAAEGHYGLGVIALAHGDLPRAQQEFLRCLERDGSHANAHFQLGVLAERQGDLDSAEGWYERSLTAFPTHQGAQEALTRLRGDNPPSTRPSPPPGTPTTPSAQPHVTDAPWSAQASNAEQYGVYDYLGEDSSQLSRQTRDALDGLRIRRMPYLSAYLASILKRVAIYIGMIALLWALPGPIISLVASVFGTSALGNWDLGSAAFGLAIAICVVEFVVYLLRVVTTRYTLERGRLQIETGVLFRKLTNLELWRVENVQLHRSPLQRLTRDGTLVIDVLRSAQPASKLDLKRGPVRVVGLARDAELNTVYHQMLDLVWLLRGNPWVKGIIY